MDRLVSISDCREVTDKHPDYFTFDAEDWFSKPNNYALIEGKNISFGEYKSEGLYWVHFCFDEARGREAINLTKRMLEAFYEAVPVVTSIGVIDVKNLKARWLIRQVGFKSLGNIETGYGLCEMFYWTKVL